VADIDWTVAVDRALESTGGQTDSAAGEALGVSESTYRRWRIMREQGEDIPEPRGVVRDALWRFVEASGGNGTPPTPSHLGGDRAGEAEALEMPEVWPRIDALNADQSISETVRLIRIEQVLAAGRMALQHKEARAAEARTRTIEKEGDRADRRTLAIEREGERADARLALHQDEGAEPTPPAGRAGPEETAAAARGASRRVHPRKDTESARRRGQGGQRGP
jgi:hypothetical protein